MKLNDYKQLDPNSNYINIYHDSFSVGVYWYELIVDGKIFDTKKFIVN